MNLRAVYMSKMSRFIYSFPDPAFTTYLCAVSDLCNNSKESTTTTVLKLRSAHDFDERIRILESACQYDFAMYDPKNITDEEATFLLAQTVRTPEGRKLMLAGFPDCKILFDIVSRRV